jgi:aminoglycoside/choline kinase family phosphotransferase
MSDSLYNPSIHLPIVQHKDKGILQFSTIGDNRGDLEKRMAKLKEYRSNADDLLLELLKDTEPEQTSKKRTYKHQL